MEDKAKKEEDLKNLSNKIKMIFLIYDYVRSSSKNINEFNISKIVLTRDIKKKTFEEVFNSYKNRSYNQSSNLNNKTLYFIDLMKNIMSYDYRPDVSNTQLLLTYDLVTIFHKETSPEDVAGMDAAEGILTQRGGMTSHAAVVARGWGKCCVSGCSDIKIDYEKATLTIGNTTMN